MQEFSFRTLNTFIFK